ncbi:MAG: CAP domain-containing protein [Leptolyngbyaceae cyanobacterium SM2_5_2]|nr:CAP domain-containing protein [Leptolyngbyaceae cyanobacterium SM2_5_2]
MGIFWRTEGWRRAVPQTLWRSYIASLAAPLLLAPAITGAGSRPPNGQATPYLLSQASTSQLATLLGLINTERQQIGAPALVLSPQLVTAAQGHAQDMAHSHRLSHSGSNGSSLQARIDATGYTWAAIGENVAMGQPNPAAVMEAWMNSPGHRQNILNPNFTELGLGYAEQAGEPYWVQVFGKPL